MRLDRAVAAVNAVSLPAVPLVPDEPGYAAYAAHYRHGSPDAKPERIAGGWEFLSIQSRNYWRAVALGVEEWIAAGAMPPVDR